MTRVGGIHHVTAIAGDPQENLDFYAGTLGLRLVKRSVNQDDPTTYHLFYADREGHPGTDLTFFPWPDGRRGSRGAGQVVEVHFAARPESLAYWRDRLDEAGLDVEELERFEEARLRFKDPHGLTVAIVGTPLAEERTFTAWEKSTVPEEHQIRGLHAVRVLERDATPILTLSRDVLGMQKTGEDAGWTRYEGHDATSGFLELKEDAQASPGKGGVGTVHHVAWRTRDEDESTTLQEAVREQGLSATPVIDRFWFKSIYFREPGGVLYELATEGPGFQEDEPLDTLGESLVLPPWLEESREKIERVLPDLVLPYETEA